MKKTITILALFIFGISRSQVVADFEGFSLPANSYYKDVNSTDWQTSNASFQYDWVVDTIYGSYWSAGFAYTNIMNVDSGNYRWLYNCAAGKGYNLSNYYVSCQPGGIIRVKSPNDGVVGFYITNTTYAYMSMKNGDAIGKKFGGATGNDPDWFKLTVRGYKNGSLKSDSVEFYLADFRSSNNANDYILKTWQWVDCNPLGQVDSVTFFLSSSDNSSWGMNTPAFFAMDNFTTGQGVGINEVSAYDGLNIYPNPTNGKVSVKLLSVENVNVDITVYNSIGVLMKKENVNFNTGYNTHLLNLEEMESGMYFIQLSGTDKKQIIKIIKN